LTEEVEKVGDARSQNLAHKLTEKVGDGSLTNLAHKSDYPTNPPRGPNLKSDKSDKSHKATSIMSKAFLPNVEGTFVDDDKLTGSKEEDGMPKGIQPCMPKGSDQIDQIVEMYGELEIEDDETKEDDTLVLKGFRPYWSDARPYKPYYTEAQMDEMVEMYLNGELELVASDEDDEIMEMP
jgi:hypothetical protein